MAEVAGYEQSLREALPLAGARELWTAGSVSPRAQAALEARGWVVHARAESELTEAPKTAAR